MEYLQKSSARSCSPGVGGDCSDSDGGVGRNGCGGGSGCGIGCSRAGLEDGPASAKSPADIQPAGIPFASSLIRCVQLATVTRHT